MEIDFKIPFSQEEIRAIQQSRLDAVWNRVMAKYPKMRLETLERNLSTIEEIFKYDEACKSCMGVGMCPTRDGNRMQGRLDADGVMSIYMTPCPQGHKIPKVKAQESSREEWKKSR